MKSDETRKTMNRNFRVKVNYKKTTILVGWRGLVEYVGRTTAFILVSRAMSSGMDNYTFRGRNGITIRFYAK